MVGPDSYLLVRVTVLERDAEGLYLSTGGGNQLLLEAPNLWGPPGTQLMLSGELLMDLDPFVHAVECQQRQIRFLLTDSEEP